MYKRNFFFNTILIWIVFFLAACKFDHPLNSPYRSSESGKNVLYSSFSERPKHLDPVRSYSSNEYSILAQIYEPPFQYHYLKRPYELIPLTAVKVPNPLYYNKNGKLVSKDVPEGIVDKVIYTIKIKPSILYQEHPAFAKDNSGNYLYHSISYNDMKSIYKLKDFKQTGSRELLAEDYIYQIKRMANPLFHCPVFPVMATYIQGFSEYAASLRKQLKRIRNARKKSAGAVYNQELDEQKNPILLDLGAYPLTGVKKVDKYTYQIILKKKYPQFIYWMAMPFFAPMPWEAEAFYYQGPVVDRQISLNWYPIGTGPYRLAVHDPNREMVLVKNENFHGEFYPNEGFKGARSEGLLKDGGKEIPFIEKVIFKLEKENIPYWNKFLQGYYDTSGISSDSFDQVININTNGHIGLTESMKVKNIRLATSVKASTYYIGFNMLDDVVGGYSIEQKKLRQAISIAVDYEEYIRIFLNGRGISAQSPLPPGIYGYSDGKPGINPYVFNWEKGKIVRKSIVEAKKLLTEAGYPGGKNKETGKPLLLYFDTTASGPDSKSYLDWLRKQFKKIDIQLVVRSTDYNRFQDKMSNGTEQIFQWGWNADYPDPENFLFLLYGPNKKVKMHGENAANYENSKFDRLFKKMVNMENSPKRFEIIKQMLAILQEDAPWLFGLHPVSFGLYHEWFQNAYPNLMANNTLKYKRLIPELRIEKRREWNQPVLWPLILLVSIFLLTIGHFVINNFKKDNIKKRGTT